MYRIISLILALVIAPFAVGQPPKDAVAPAPAAKPGRAELTATAAPAPVPALRVELLPPGRDKVPGNAAVGYFKAVALQPPWPRDPEAGRKLHEKLDQWEGARPDQLPTAEVEEFFKAYRDMLRTVDDAARMDRCDWQQRLAGPEAISGSLTVVQGHRELARWLSLRAKLELARDRPADAVRTLQTGFRLGKDVGEGGTLIQMLVGQAITSIMVGRAEDVIRHPDGPNLYWALTTLPRPLIDPRPSLDGEARFSTSFLPWLKEMQAGPVSEDQAQKALRDTLRMMGAVAQDVPKEEKLTDLIGNFGLAAGLAAQGKQAKKDLLARGWKEKDVAAMPNAQAVILLTAAVHQEVWDDQVKLFHLPVPAAAAEMARTRKRADDLRKAHPDNPLIAVFAMLYPAVEKVHHAHVRVDRRLTQLRAVEAVRLHAAASGAVPKALAEATTVPVPDDPATGKPFEYKADGDTFTLTAPPPKGEAPNPSNAFEYVVTVRKK
jgi:hypothetical protein